MWTPSTQSCLAKKLLRIYDMNPLSLLHKFLSNLLIASEEAIVSSEEPQGPVRRETIRYRP
jgi:hypothetical protein